MSVKSFSQVGIIGRQGSPHIDDSLRLVHRVLADHGCSVVVERKSSSLMTNADLTVVDRSDMRDCDLLVVVGGDGSILGVARDFAEVGIPVLGVNRGGLGFLADIQPDQIEDSLAEILSGSFKSEEHFLIEQQIVRQGEVVHRSLALNDIVVSSGSLSRMLDFKLSIGDEFVYEIRSDGILISTPTGSTAYSLSAGGTIMHPQLGAISITPLYPHTLTSRQIAVPCDLVTEVAIAGDSQTARSSSDSQVEFELQAGDVVRIEKYSKELQIIYAATHSFYEACRSKLDWGSRLSPTTD